MFDKVKNCMVLWYQQEEINVFLLNTCPNQDIKLITNSSY